MEERYFRVIETTTESIARKLTQKTKYYLPDIYRCQSGECRNTDFVKVQWTSCDKSSVLMKQQVVGKYLNTQPATIHCVATHFADEPKHKVPMRTQQLCLQKYGFLAVFNTVNINCSVFKERMTSTINFVGSCFFPLTSVTETEGQKYSICLQRLAKATQPFLCAEETQKTTPKHY